jgi:hypothetical protein
MFAAAGVVPTTPVLGSAQRHGEVAVRHLSAVRKAVEYHLSNIYAKSASRPGASYAVISRSALSSSGQAVELGSMTSM